MRVVHLSCVAPPQTGGVGTVAHEEALRLEARGIETAHVSLSTHAGLRFGNAGRVWAVDHFLRDADIVHLHYPFYGMNGAIAARRRDGRIKRLVMTLHMDAHADGIRGVAFNLHRRFFQPRILSVADALLVSTEDYARHSSYAPVADRAITLPFGIDEQRFRPRSDAAGFAPDARPFFLFVGGMDTAHAFKGVPQLLEASAPLATHDLVLVGDGDLRASFEKQAASLGISGRCRFVGKVDAEQLVSLYQSAFALVLPSTSMAEAFGLVALEAQACGCPVIASDLPGVRRVVSHEESGLLVPPGDVAALRGALSKLVSDEPLRQRFGACAVERVRAEYTWDRHVDKLLDIYRSLV